MPSNLGSAQVALALIVLKSKPNGMSLENYFKQLRGHIQSGPRSISEEHEHLDSIAFWKQAYEESEAAQAKLLDRIYELDEGQTMARNGLALLEMPASPVIDKRKRKNESTAKANSQSKRRAILTKTLQLPESLTEDSPYTEKAIELDELPKCPATYMRHFFNLRQQIVSKRPDPHALHHALRDLCHVAASLISSSTLEVFPAWQSKTSRAQTSTSNLQSTTLAIQRSHPSLLQGLDKLCEKSNSTREVGSVVYEVIVLFETILANISTFAVQAAKGVDESRPKAKTGRAKTRASNQSQGPSSQDQHTALQDLAHLAVTTLTAVDPSVESHSQILEGCLCAFLDRLGSSLSLAVFTDDRSTDQREMFTGLMPPQGLHEMSNVDPGTALRAVQLQAPYLIYILENAMAFVDSHQALMSSQSASLFSLSKGSRVSNDDFAQQIKVKLQNTLLKGVFGNEDETFRNALQKPAQLECGVDADRPISQAERTPQWLTGEIWRILGWEILADDDA